MKKWQKLLISFGFVCLSIGAGYGGYKLAKYEAPKKEEKLKNLATVSQIYDTLFNSYLDTSYLLDEIQEISSVNVSDIILEDAPFTKDGFFMNKLSTKDKDGQDIKEYEKAHDMYVENLVKNVKENLAYKIKKEEKLSDISLNQTVTIKSFNMYLYRADFYAIYNSLLDAYYNTPEIASKTNEMSETEKQKFKVNAYKAKVKTFEIMNTELSRYKNDKEKDIIIQYVNEGTIESPKWKCVNPFEVYNAITYGDGNLQSINDTKRIQDIYAKSYNKKIDVQNYLKLEDIEKGK